MFRKPVATFSAQAMVVLPSEAALRHSNTQIRTHTHARAHARTYACTEEHARTLAHTPAQFLTRALSQPDEDESPCTRLLACSRICSLFIYLFIYFVHTASLTKALAGKGTVVKDQKRA